MKTKLLLIISMWFWVFSLPAQEGILNIIHDNNVTIGDPTLNIHSDKSMLIEATQGGDKVLVTSSTPVGGSSGNGIGTTDIDITYVDANNAPIWNYVYGIQGAILIPKDVITDNISNTDYILITGIQIINGVSRGFVLRLEQNANPTPLYFTYVINGFEEVRFHQILRLDLPGSFLNGQQQYAILASAREGEQNHRIKDFVMLIDRLTLDFNNVYRIDLGTDIESLANHINTMGYRLMTETDNADNSLCIAGSYKDLTRIRYGIHISKFEFTSGTLIYTAGVFFDTPPQFGNGWINPHHMIFARNANNNNRGTLWLTGGKKNTNGSDLATFYLSFGSDFSNPVPDFMNEIPPIDNTTFLIRGVYNSNLHIIGNEIFITNNRGDLIEIDWTGNRIFIKSITGSLRSLDPHPAGDFVYDANANLFYGVTLVNNIMTIITMLPDNTDGCCFQVNEGNATQPVARDYNTVQDLFGATGGGQDQTISRLIPDPEIEALVVCRFCNDNTMEIDGPTEVWCDPVTYTFEGCNHFGNFEWLLFGPVANHQNPGKIVTTDRTSATIDFSKITTGNNQQPGNYQLRYVERINGEDPACSPILASLDIVFRNLACPNATINGPQAIICNGSGTYTFTGCSQFPAGTTYQWTIHHTTGNMEASFNGPSTGISVNIDFANATGNNTYELTMTATFNGCTFVSNAYQITHNLPAFSGVVSGTSTINCNVFEASYDISNPDNIPITSYAWSISPSGPIIINGTTSHASINFGLVSGPFTLTCKINIGGCIVERQFTIQTVDCCPITNTYINEYQSSYNTLKRSDPSHSYIGQTMGVFTSSNNHSIVLQNITDLPIPGFSITEASEQGNIISNQLYTLSQNNFEASDFIESYTPNGKIVIGHKNNTLYMIEVDPSGALVPSHQKSVTWANQTVEATSIVQTFFNNDCISYTILVNLRANNVNKVYLLNISVNFTFNWARQVLFDQSNHTPFHGHKLMACPDAYGNTGTFIVLGSSHGGNVYKGVITDTRIDGFGNSFIGPPNMLVSTNIYFCAAILPEGFVFGGNNDPMGFNLTTNAALLHTDFNLTTLSEKTIPNIKMEALNVAISPSSGNPVFLLLSHDDAITNNSYHPYFYHLLELDQNLDLIQGKNLQVLNHYQNYYHDHDPYLSSKTLLDLTNEGGFIAAGQEEDGFDFMLCKTGSDLISRCNTEFEIQLQNEGESFIHSGFVDYPSATLNDITMSPQILDIERICCNDRDGAIFSECDIFNAHIEFHFTATGIFISDEDILFEALGTFNPLDVASYEWDFGDGQTYTSTSSNQVHHTFSVPFTSGNINTFTVNLIIHFKNGCSKKFTDLLGIAKCHTPNLETSCHRIVYFCDLYQEPEGVLPDCQPCYSMGDNIELLPLEELTFGSYRREIINHSTCRKCIFTFEMVRQACDFDASFTSLLLAGNPSGTAMYSNTSTLGPLTEDCDDIPTTWTVIDLTTAGQLGVPNGNNISFPIEIGHTYKVCMTVTYCACGKQCTRTICETFTVGQGPEIKPGSNGGTDHAAQNTGTIRGKTQDNITLVKNNIDLAIKPNPTSEKFTVFNLTGLENYEQVTIYTMSGQVVLSKDNVAAGFEYNLSDYAKGIYTIKITAAGETRVLKLVLQ